MRSLFILMAFGFVNFSFGQDISQKVTIAYNKMMEDSQLSHGIVSLYVIDSKTGDVVFDKYSHVGLAGASVQKVITSSTAFALLGHNYTYKTDLGYNGSIKNNTLFGNIIIRGSGDPTLGSWRYTSTKEEKIVDEFRQAINMKGIKKLNGDIYGSDTLWQTEVIPPGWIWEDLGSYYGAGASALNWRENQYDLIMKSGNRVGDTVTFIGTVPQKIEGLKIKMLATAAEKGSGDRSYIYIPSINEYSSVRGSIPLGQDHFVISGTIIRPDLQASSTLKNVFPSSFFNLGSNDQQTKSKAIQQLIYSHTSPTMDSIVYWFLKKSINLYGEALVKTIAYEKTKIGSVDTGINIIKQFWKDKGIDPQSLNMKDGSGLSPGNRITANALVTILQYDLKQSWFNSFLDALPEINGLKMKSGTIADVLAYTGFSKSVDGKKYTFAIIVNNYNGSTTTMRQKMWKLLDVLK